MSTRPDAAPKAAVVVACLVSLILVGSPAPLQAICLGCPPVAWKASLELADGTRVLGYLSLSEFLVAEKIDLAGQELPGEWAFYAPASVQVWTEALAVHHVYDGHCLRAWGDSAGETPSACRFSLPDRHLLLLGEPRTIARDAVISIEDASCLEGCTKVYSRFLVAPGRRHLSSEEAALLVRPPRLALRVELGNDGAMAYCFADDGSVTLEDLVARCRHHPSDDLPPVPPGVLRLVDDPGT